VRFLVGLLLATMVAACVEGDAAVSTIPTTTTSRASTTSTAAQVPAFPHQPEGVPWPTQEWATADLPDGVDGSTIDAATEIAFNDGGTDRLRAVIIVHGGMIVYERYSASPADGPDEIMPAFSIAKSVTSAIIGTLVRDGLLEVDEPAPVPEWHEDPGDPRGEITLEHMLHMSTGMPWEDGLEPGTTMSEMVATDDMAAYAAAQQSTWSPGEQFEYNTGTTTLLARMVGDVIEADDPSAVRAYLETELFDRLGMDPVRTEFDEAGTWLGGFSADTTARDYANLGLLYLRGGLWDGEQVLPADWVEYSRTPSPANPEYGAHWWLDPERPGVSYAVGARGQAITVDPAHDLVIVQLATVGGPLILDHTEAILAAFTDLDSGS
jgi:CubicO group peptidase (beta-lactamase class C family)